MLRVKRWLFRVARSRFAAYFIGNAFAHLTPLMPLDKLYVDDDVIVFKHPVPFWQTHWLVVPKRRIPTFMDLPLFGDSITIAIFQAAQTVTKQMGLGTFRLLVNGGAYQDVPQLHFHIAVDSSKNGNFEGNETFVLPKNQEEWITYRSASIYAQTNTEYANHFVIQSFKEQRPFSDLNLSQRQYQESLLDILNLAQQTIAKNNLTAYTLSTTITSDSNEERLTFHLVS